MSADQWPVFKSKIALLNKDAPAGVVYKVLFFGRHRQGFHKLFIFHLIFNAKHIVDNFAELKYVKKAWHEYDLFFFHSTSFLYL
jgi:hypothetical protein